MVYGSILKRTQIRKCKKCGEYTEHIYRGKEHMERGDLIFHGMLTIATGGLWLIFALLFDDRDEFWECSKCGRIHKVRG